MRSVRCIAGFGSICSALNISAGVL